LALRSDIEEKVALKRLLIYYAKRKKTEGSKLRARARGCKRAPTKKGPKR